ncbi:MAG: hypothetical protein M1818_002596 [Claussenomyces sp. TS43310]|nr:MAG: hypothetical protein M1818_002596 [Claussenomyces sp. TS43310]
MPYLPTAQEWLTQSALLLQARPTTTRITTKYTTVDPSKPKKSKRTVASQDSPVGAATTPAAAPLQLARANLTLKTFDPVSGVTLKYRTTKQQEVGRLFASLGRLGRHMAGLPELKEDVAMTDVPVEAGAAPAVSGVGTPVAEKAPAASVAPGGGKKKKKGRK